MKNGSLVTVSTASFQVENNPRISGIVLRPVAQHLPDRIAHFARDSGAGSQAGSAQNALLAHTPATASAAASKRSWPFSAVAARGSPMTPWLVRA